MYAEKNVGKSWFMRAKAYNQPITDFWTKEDGKGKQNNSNIKN